MILVKEPGPFQPGFERSQLRSVMDSARAAFAGVSLFRKKRVVWVVSPNSGVNGQLIENIVPTFWSDALSRIFGDAAPVLDVAPAQGSRATTNSPTGALRTATPRRGRKTPTDTKREKAKQMRASGYTYTEIATTIKISKSYAFKLVNAPG